MILKMIALGYFKFKRIFKGKNTYFKTNWNKMDFIIVISGLISMYTNMD